MYINEIYFTYEISLLGRCVPHWVEGIGSKFLPGSLVSSTTIANARALEKRVYKLIMRAVEDVLKPPGSLLATDRSKPVVLV